MSEKTIRRICPFYMDNQGRNIFCAGITEDVMLHTDFIVPQAAREYKKTYCTGCYFRCKNARMLNEVLRCYDVTSCKYNRFIECADTTECKSCGWCPEVAETRLRAYLSRRISVHKNNSKSAYRLSGSHQENN